ncbi:hypothetical protein [Streptomyces sp. CoH17]|uniref:hypothetical protein n=1 Tax=Streptomyces sp. CoH17 TaxID=2992806 RepID=UPI0022700647|nr:hypothetical protein [Streptomyces sp. CoH17]
MKKVSNGFWVTRSDGGKYAIRISPNPVLKQYEVTNEQTGEKLGANTTRWREAIQMIEEAQTQDALALQALKQKSMAQAIRCRCDLPDEQKDQQIIDKGTRYRFCRGCAIEHYQEKLKGTDSIAASRINGASRTLEQSYKRRLKELGVQV